MLNVYDCPLDVENGHNKQYHVSKEADCRECVSSIDLFKECQLKELTNKEHEVEEAKYHNEHKSIVHHERGIFNNMFKIINKG